MSQQRYPLSWPAGWKRTNRFKRRRAEFRSRGRALSMLDAIGRLSGQCERLGAGAVVLSSNVELRLDGWPRSGQPAPEDPGAAVYFTLKGKPRCLACDAWDRVEDNVAAIAQHIDALRRIDRYGVGTIEQAFAGYTALPPSAEDWRTVFGLQGRPGWEAVEARYRELAMQHHPDVGGDPHQMSKLNAARDAARVEYQS